ncbi:MAG: hypothetical protein ISS19_06480 [Bacteroidales bacterium]|nr:hypothetical protein [Bacteroidales bacterium]
MAKSFQLSILIILFCLTDGMVVAQSDNNQSFGQLALVNRMDSTKVKFIRADKSIKIRMLDGRRLDGHWHLSDEQTMVVGDKVIPMKEIYSLAGYVQTDSKDKTLGAGLIMLSAVASAYPAYLIFSGFALGQPQAVFVGATIIFLDLFLAYAGASLMGIYSRRFNRLNWDIRIDYKLNQTLIIPGELPSLQPDW